jgi:hypothetical protein
LNLYLSSSAHPVEPLPESLDLLFAELVAEKEGFFVLSVDELTYLQGTWKSGDGFLLEYQVGRLEEHYCFSEPLGLATVLAIANLYLAGDVTWRNHPDWVHEPLERAEEESKAPVHLGSFNGVGARRILSALEGREGDFYIEPAGDGIALYASRDHAEEGRALLERLFPP